jgi:hypothetical protein
MSHVGVGQFRLQHVVKDTEISERVGGQVLALQPDVYVRKDRLGDFWEIVIELMKKLEKTKYHADRCALLTKEAQANATAPSTGVQHADHTSGIEAEVEAFLFQCKATLDVLAKLLRPTANINLATFGDKGDTVIKSLQRNVAKDRAPKAAELVRLLEQDQAWLNDMITLRDTVGHFRAWYRRAFGRNNSAMRWSCTNQATRTVCRSPSSLPPIPTISSPSRRTSSRLR